MRRMALDWTLSRRQGRFWSNTPVQQSAVCMVDYSAAEYNTVHYSIKKHIIVQSNAVQYSTEKNGKLDGSTI